MNLPNRLTIIRMILIIPFVVILLNENLWEYGNLAALIIFILASFTDWLDGYIARRDNLITNFGKFMDPLADKMLVTSALICLLHLRPDLLPAWAVIIIIAREFIISGFRLVASDAGIVIAASIWGKSKTVSQMAMVIIMLADIKWKYMPIVNSAVMYAAVILTLISLLDYVWKNRGVLEDKKQI